MPIHLTYNDSYLSSPEQIVRSFASNFQSSHNLIILTACTNLLNVTFFTEDVVLAAIKKLKYKFTRGWIIFLPLSFVIVQQHLWRLFALFLICACVLAPFLVVGRQQDFVQYLRKGNKYRPNIIVLSQLCLILLKYSRLLCIHLEYHCGHNFQIVSMV